MLGSKSLQYIYSKVSRSIPIVSEGIENEHVTSGVHYLEIILDAAFSQTSLFSDRLFLGKLWFP